METVFAPAQAEDLPHIYLLIDSRIRWMDAAGIRQWNVTDYRKAYPDSYFEEQLRCRRLYVLKSKDRVLASLVLLEQDNRWIGDAEIPAYYIHNLVSLPGFGRQLLEAVTEMARSAGKAALRLDCAINNEKLNRYYEDLGFQTAGICRAGSYTGNKRQKFF